MASAECKSGEEKLEIKEKLIPENRRTKYRSSSGKGIQIFIYGVYRYKRFTGMFTRKSKAVSKVSLFFSLEAGTSFLYAFASSFFK